MRKHRDERKGDNKQSNICASHLLHYHVWRFSIVAPKAIPLCRLSTPTKEFHFSHQRLDALIDATQYWKILRNDNISFDKRRTSTRKEEQKRRRLKNANEPIYHTLLEHPKWTTILGSKQNVNWMTEQKTRNEEDENEEKRKNKDETVRMHIEIGSMEKWPNESWFERIETKEEKKLRTKWLTRCAFFCAYYSHRVKWTNQSSRTMTWWRYELSDGRHRHLNFFNRNWIRESMSACCWGSNSNHWHRYAHAQSRTNTEQKNIPLAAESHAGLFF